MNDLDSLLSSWAQTKRSVTAPSDFADSILDAIQDTPTSSDFRLPNSLTTPICLAVGIFKFAFVLQLAF